LPAVRPSLVVVAHAAPDVITGAPAKPAPPAWPADGAGRFQPVQARAFNGAAVQRL
jgi:hypothetical protein